MAAKEMHKKNIHRCLGLALIVAVVGVAGSLFRPPAVVAVPSFARQTGMTCIACHTEFPILTEYGRQFKISGYTMGSGQTSLPPIAFMLLPGFTHTAKGQDGGAAPRFGDNNNFALGQASVFYAGRLFGPYTDNAFLNKFGTFFQATYNGVDRTFGWDNFELRYADTATVGGKSLIYGFYLNNNPSMSDPWNTTPVWGFPFSSSPLAPTPAASPLIAGGLAQQVAGLGAYVSISNTIYLEFAGYHTLGTGFQRAMGVNTDGQTQVPGVAPYWRLAYTKTMGNNSLMLGVYGLAAATYPGRDRTAGKDRIIDFGFDAQWQAAFGKHGFTALATLIYEKQQWNASQQLELASNKSDHLWMTKLTIDYLYDSTVGGAIGYFNINGNHDPSLYSGSTQGSPLSDGLIFQLNYLPFNKKGGPSFWSKSNVKFSIQYVMYNRFDGAHSNYDGTGRNARDNNTLYFEAWIAF